MSDNGLIGGIEGDGGPEDDLDAFNDDTFGGSGLGDEWREDVHEELAQLTEQERMALKQSQDFFNFASDGEELGGELEDGLEAGPGLNGGERRDPMVQRMDQLSLQGGGLPPAPLTVQTSGGQMGGQPMGQPVNFPQQQQQVIYHHQLPPQPVMQQQPGLMPQQQQAGPPQQFPLLPPSHFGPGPAPGQFQDPAIMSLSKLPPPQQPQFMAGAGHQHQQPGQPQFMGQQPPQFQQQQAGHRPTFSPPTVPGMKTLADLEAEMMFGGPRPPVHNQPQAMAMDRGHVGHINPAMHNLNYPGMRDRQQTQQQQIHQQQQQRQQQQSAQMHQQQQQQQQFRNSPGLTNQQQLQQGLQHHLQHNQHNNQNHRNQQQQQRFNNNNFHDGGNRRRNDYHQYENRRDGYYDRDHQDGHHRQQRRGGGGYNDINRRNEETFGAAAVKEQEVKEFGDQSVTRRDLMPGHVHTLGILRHSRSRHDRHNLDTFGEDQETATMAANPTGDPLLDARMVEEEEEMARRRKHYANTEDEYAGLMSQKDKQWIINIQLNQLKCDNPYVDDYYFTIYQARKEEQKHRDDNRAGKELLLNESVVDLNTSYTPAQFENSLGKLQCVTVKAPRQIIDVGVVRVPETPRATDSPVTGGGDAESPGPGLVSVTLDRKPAGEYKLLLMKIEVLFSALLDLEADKLKLEALPTGAPLREQISHDEVSHLQILQSGLSSAEVVSDCLAVAKGRNLVLRSLAYLSHQEIVLNTILANIHHVARNDQMDLQFWSLLAKYIDSASLEKLEPAATTIVNMKSKNKKSVLSTSLGASIILTLILKASLDTGKSNNNLDTWALLARTLLSSVAEGAVLGSFLARFSLSESSLASLLSLDNTLKPAWLNIVEQSKGVEVSS